MHKCDQCGTEMRKQWTGPQKVLEHWKCPQCGEQELHGVSHGQRIIFGISRVSDLPEDMQREILGDENK